MKRYRVDKVAPFAMLMPVAGALAGAVPPRTIVDIVAGRWRDRVRGPDLCHDRTEESLSLHHAAAGLAAGRVMGSPLRTTSVERTRARSPMRTKWTVSGGA